MTTGYTKYFAWQIETGQLQWYRLRVEVDEFNNLESLKYLPVTARGVVKLIGCANGLDFLLMN